MPKGKQGFQKGHKTFSGVEEGWFKKGQIPYNKGKRMPKISGENNVNWKGNGVGYYAIHDWLIRWYGKADKCENPKCKGKSNTFQWAKLENKEYERKRENFRMLCRSCHVKYDITKESRKKMSESAIKRWRRNNPQQDKLIK